MLEAAMLKAPIVEEAMSKGTIYNQQKDSRQSWQKAKKKGKGRQKEKWKIQENRGTNQWRLYTATIRDQISNWWF